MSDEKRIADAADVDELLRGHGSGTWLGVDVVMVAFDLRRSAAYQLAIDDQWRTAPPQRIRGRGRPAKQWAFDDIQRTWQRLRARPDQRDVK